MDPHTSFTNKISIGVFNVEVVGLERCVGDFDVGNNAQAAVWSAQVVACLQLARIDPRAAFNPAGVDVAYSQTAPKITALNEIKTRLVDLGGQNSSGIGGGYIAAPDLSWRPASFTDHVSVLGQRLEIDGDVRELRAELVG